MRWVSDDSEVEARGASKAINKTIKEIDAILAGEELIPVMGLRRKLRRDIYQALETLSERWYKRGFNRGHIESFERFDRTGSVPRKLTKTVRREFVRNRGRSEVQLSSRVKRDV